MNAPEEMLLHQAGPPLQDRIDGLPVTVLDGHRDQVCGPVRPGPPRLDDGLHPDLDDAALERLHQVVQVIDLPFREDDEHLLAPFHRVDGVAFRLLVPASSLHGEGAEALEPPAGAAEALVERLAVHHVEEPAAATARELQAGPHVHLVGVVGDEDGARPGGRPRSTSRSRGSIRSRLRQARSSRLRIWAAQMTNPGGLAGRKREGSWT